MIYYKKFEGENISADDFFVGWTSRPSQGAFDKMLRGSNTVLCAIDDAEEDASKVVGLITAISDNSLNAFIPFLEIRASHQGKGIGHELLTLMIEEMKSMYAIDLICDQSLVPFYKNAGMHPAFAMSIRNYFN